MIAFLLSVFFAGRLERFVTGLFATTAAAALSGGMRGTGKFLSVTLARTLGRARD